MAKRLSLRIICLILALLTVFLLLPGCLSGHFPDEYGYAVLIAIDRGTVKPFLISMLLQHGNVEQSEASSAYTLISVECNDMFEAVDLIETGLPYSLSLARTSAIIFSEEIAASGDIDKLLSVSLGMLSIHYYANLMVSIGSAGDYIRGLQDGMSENLTKLQHNYVAFGAATGLVPSITLAQFYDGAWQGDYTELLPLCAIEQNSGGEDGGSENEDDGRKGGNEDDDEDDDEDGVKSEDIVARIPSGRVDMAGGSGYLPGENMREGGLDSGLMGSAVLDGTRMVGTLNGRHTQALLMATGAFSQGRLNVTMDDGVEIGAMLFSEQNPKIRADIKNCAGSITIHLSADIEQPVLMQKYGDGAVTHRIEEHIESMLNNIFDACKREGADVFSFKKAAQTKLITVEQWESFDWDAVFNDFEATFDVNIEIKYNPAKSRLE